MMQIAIQTLLYYSHNKLPSPAFVYTVHNTIENDVIYTYTESIWKWSVHTYVFVYGYSLTVYVCALRGSVSVLPWSDSICVLYIIALCL